MATSADDLRRRVIGWRVAERREQALRAEEGPLAPDAALRAAFDLHDLVPMNIRASDVTRAREIELARRAWRTLRLHLTRR